MAADYFILRKFVRLHGCFVQIFSGSFHQRLFRRCISSWFCFRRICTTTEAASLGKVRQGRNMRRLFLMLPQVRMCLNAFPAIFSIPAIRWFRRILSSLFSQFARRFRSLPLTVHRFWRQILLCFFSGALRQSLFKTLFI